MDKMNVEYKLISLSQNPRFVGNYFSFKVLQRSLGLGTVQHSYRQTLTCCTPGLFWLFWLDRKVFLLVVLKTPTVLTTAYFFLAALSSSISLVVRWSVRPSVLPSVGRSPL